MNTIETLINKIKALRAEGFTYADIDEALNLKPEMLEGCTYRDVSYRITKSAAWTRNNYAKIQAVLFI